MPGVLDKYGRRTNLEYCGIELLLLGNLMALKTDDESLSLINHQLRVKLKAKEGLFGSLETHLLQLDAERVEVEAKA